MQVCAAVRMCLYHTGQLERTKAGTQPGCVSRVWHAHDADLAALCQELHQWQQRVLYAPKFLHQAVLLCEVAAFVSSAHEDGPAVADAFKDMAAKWASLFDAELRGIESQSSDDAGSNRADVQAKLSLAHALVVLCHSASSTGVSATGSTTEVPRHQAEQLCFHMVQAATHARFDCGTALSVRLQAALQQCARVMASHVHALDVHLLASPALLSHAARAVFRELPETAAWRPVKGALGCYVTDSEGSTYGVNLLCGRALRNGRVPGHLPAAILEHPDYKRAFGQAMFEVTAEAQGDHTMYRSARSVSGRLYTWLLIGRRLTVCATAVDPASGHALPETELELLPYGCEWCPALPQRLKRLHSHWLSRRTATVLLRGKAYDSPSTYFLLTPAGDSDSSGMDCYVVPSHREHDAWESLLASRGQLEQLWQTPADSAPTVLLTRFEARQFIHVTTDTAGASGQPRRLRFHLPRFRLQFQLAEGSSSLACVQYAEYHVPATPTEIPAGSLAVPPGLREFIVLQHTDPSMPCRVLIPDGTVSGAARSSSVSVTIPADDAAAGAELQHHAYSRHPRTRHLDTAVVQSRLFLAALHAAADLRLPLPGLGATGGEHALHMLRRCRVSRPLTAGEDAALCSLRSFASHTPSLTLACTAFLRDSQVLSFLHNSSSPPAPPSIQSDEIGVYQQEVRQAENAGFVNPRRLLEAAEAAQCACVPPARPRRAEALSWAAIERKMDGHCRRATEHAVQRGFQKRLQAISARHLRQAEAPQVEHLECLQPGLQRLRESAHGREVVRDHEESVAALLGSPGMCGMAGVNLVQLRSELQTLGEDVGAAVATLQLWLLEALADGGGGADGAVLTAMRCAGAACTPAPADLIEITIFPDLPQDINPLLSREACDRLKEHALLWQELCVLQDKLARCVVRCDAGATWSSAGMDASLSALEQELCNVRAWSTAARPEWLAFEVLQGLEIRHRQYVVAEHMLEHPGGPGMAEEDRGAVVQLNMGEGKTRVILPMLVLALCGRGEVVRLNFLQELLPEAVDYLHSCLTGTLLQVKLLNLPFSRNVEMDAPQLQQLSRQMRICMHGRAFVCISREHRMSLQLKAQELLSRRDTEQHAILDSLLSLPGWDILDECDQLLSHKFQLVYAWGTQAHLPSLEARVQMAQAVLEALAFDRGCQAILSDPAIAHVQHDEQHAGSLPHIRLIPGAALQAALPALRTALCKALFFQADVQPKPLIWLTALSPDCFRSFQECCLSGLTDFDRPAAKLAIEEDCTEREHVLALRGLLGMQVLEHTLQRRHRVDFGLTDRVGPGETRMAVPFRACDTPSERAEFKHPDAAIAKTHLAYYQAGIRQEQLRDALQAVLSLPLLQGEQVFREAVAQSRRHVLTAAEMGELHGIDELTKIDLTNTAQSKTLQKFLSHNFLIINFWLDACVLPRETRQFPGSLRCNAWHAATNESGKVVGFSGTVDNRGLLPLQVQVQDTGDRGIRGANGRMISTLLLSQTCSFVALDEHLPAKASATSRVSMQVLQFAIDQGANAIIDAGAQLADMELRDVAQHAVAALTARQRASPDAVTASGVVFFQTAGAACGLAAGSRTQAGWYVMDLHGRVMAKDRCPIAEADAFVLFDEAHCRGSDMKLRPDACAVLTLGPDMGREKLVQAAARLRQLEKGQAVVLLGTDEVCRSIRETCEIPDTASIRPKGVIEWVLWNTAEANAKGFGEYLLQGKHYAASLGKDIYTDEEASDLVAMYKDGDRPHSMMDLLHQPATRDGANVPLSAEGDACMALLRRHAQPYSGGAAVSLASVVDEYERDVELQQEQEQERELEEEQRVPLLDTSREHEWQNTAAALALPSATCFSSSQAVEAVPLVEALQLLPRSMMALAGEWEIMSAMNWPAAVLATHNFMHPSSQRAVIASHVRKAAALLLFSDGSALLLSERECEGVVVAMRSMAPTDVRALLVHLAFTDDISMAPASGGGDACLMLGDKALLEDPFVLCRAEQAFTAARLFNGDTNFAQRSSGMGSARHEGSRAALCRLVFGSGDRQCSRVLSGRAGRDAAHQLVCARDQAVCWPGSTLEAVCQQQISAENAVGGSQLAEPGWGWLSARQPFSW
eukprot:jgi/Ulvmu1/7578/UM038_0001.1